MNKSKRSLLKIELLNMIKHIDTKATGEVLYKTIMPTKRLFRADFYIPKLSVLIEINGGQWIDGRHNRGGSGYENDLIKLNLAGINGFTVLQYTYEMLQRGEHIKDLQQIQTIRLNEFALSI